MADRCRTRQKRRLDQGGSNEEDLLVCRGRRLTLAATSAIAQKKQLVIVVKGLDNPFFEAINQGCEKWNRENASSRVRVLLHRPGIDLGRGRRGADRAGHARQGRHRRDRDFAVERQADRPDDQDRQPDDPGHDARRRPRARRTPRLRKTYLGTDNYLMGFKHRRVHQEGQAERRHGLHDRGQSRRRQHPAPRPGHARRAVRPGRASTALKGEGGWTEVAGCPVFTNDDGAKGVQAMTDILAANPEPRRLRHHGRLAAVRRAAALSRPVQAAGRQDRQQRVRHRRRRHDRRRGGDRQGRPRHRARRPAAVRDGLQGADR